MSWDITCSHIPILSHTDYCIKVLLAIINYHFALPKTVVLCMFILPGWRMKKYSLDRNCMLSFVFRMTTQSCKQRSQVDCSSVGTSGWSGGAGGDPWLTGTSGRSCHKTPPRPPSAPSRPLLPGRTRPQAGHMHPLGEYTPRQDTPYGRHALR